MKALARGVVARERRSHRAAAIHRSRVINEYRDAEGVVAVALGRQFKSNTPAVGGVSNNCCGAPNRSDNVYWVGIRDAGVVVLDDGAVNL